MSNDQVFLEGLALVLGDYHITEFPKSGSDSIHYLLLLDQLVHHFSRLDYLLLCFLGQFYLGMSPTNGCNLVQRQVISRNYNVTHSTPSFPYISIQKIIQY